MMRPLTFFQRIVMTDSAFFTELNHEGILAVRGADAAKFLQGQLTCNLNYLNADYSSLGARCTPKGRMTFRPAASSWSAPVPARPTS